MTDRIIQPGDIVYGDITNFGYLGYKTCLYRTFIVGRKPNQKEKDLYKKLLDTKMVSSMLLRQEQLLQMPPSVLNQPVHGAIKMKTRCYNRNRAWNRLVSL